MLDTLQAESKEWFIDIYPLFTDGKSALSVGASHFNKVVSDAYKGISDEYKQHLKESSGPRIQQMSHKSIMKCGEKAFKKIQKEVRYASRTTGITFICIFTPNLNFVGSKSTIKQYHYVHFMIQTKYNHASMLISLA